MKKFFNDLKSDFSDKEYAHSYMESHAVSRLAAQIYALRKQRGWSQEQLALNTGIAQERISKIESADFESLTMKTLHKFSKAFDVHLFIAFEPFSCGILDVANLTTEKLQVKSREEDLAENFTTHTVFYDSKNEWKSFNQAPSGNYLTVIKTEPLKPTADWQDIGSHEEKAFA